MPAYFLDTSALTLRYANDPCFPKSEWRRIRRIVSDVRWTIFISELSIVEVASAFAQVCRRNSWDVRTYDALDTRFLKDLRTSRVLVRHVTALDLMRAKHLLRYAGVLKKRKLESSDAIIAECCREVALEKGGQLIFYTADWTLYTILRDIDAYKSVMRLRYLGAGKGGIPPES